MTPFDDDFYRPPLPTTAGLMFPARSKFTVRGFTLAMTPAEKVWRQFIYHSQGERETCLLALAKDDLWNLQDQPQPVGFVDIDGRQKTHRFDYRLELTDGSRIAIAVKPHDLVRKLRFRESLAAIRRDLPLSFADKVMLVTERQRHPVEVKNAELLNFFRRCRDPEADAVIADLSKQVMDSISIQELIDKTTLGGRAFRAIFRAIYAGTFGADRRQLITPNTRLCPGKDIS